jgi:tRNA dimethylallyltransferase
VSLKELGFDPLIIGLMPDRAKLYKNINARVLRMVRQGFINEVKRVSRSRLSSTARHAIGYQEFSQFLRNRLNLEEAIHETQKRTRHLAKKQLIWFRKDPRIRWIRVGGKKISEIQRTILSYWRKARQNPSG